MSDTSRNAAGTALIAWLALALLNQPFVALHGRLHSFAGRLSHHLFDVGQFIAAGLVAAALMLLRDRVLGSVGTRRRWVVDSVTSLVFFAALAAVVLPNDFSGFVARMDERGMALPWDAIIPVGVGSMFVVVMYLARLLSSGRLRWALLAMGGGISVTNNLFLPGDYFGVHFFVAVLGAMLLGAGMSAVFPKPSVFVVRRLRMGVLVVLALWSTGSVVLSPANAVRIAMFRVPGSALAPFVMRLIPQGDADLQHVTPYAKGPWFSPRAKVAGIPASRPSLLPPDPIFLLLTIDAFRAELLASERKVDDLRALSRLRDESVYFTQNRSVSPSTSASLFSMMTGKYYSATYWTRRNPSAETTPHLDPTPRLAQLLREHIPPMHTAHVISVGGLAADRGTGTGFSEEIRAGKDYEKAEKVVDAVLEVIKRHPAEPLMVYTHFIDPHLPYAKRPGDSSPYVGYLREVIDVDRAIARMRMTLEQMGVWQRCVVIVTGDHGEEFGEHGGKGHAVTMYDELLKVPLVVRVPGVAPRRISVPTSTMDVGPTVLDLLGLETPGHWMGQSLVPILRGETPTLDRPIAGDASRRMQMIVFPNGIKVIEDIQRRTIEIYDLQKDPGETSNLLETMGAEGDPYVNGLRVFFKANAYTRDGYVPPVRRF